MAWQKEGVVSANHEMGHALVGHCLPDDDPVHKTAVVSQPGSFDSVMLNVRRLLLGDKSAEEDVPDDWVVIEDEDAGGRNAGHHPDPFGGRQCGRIRS